MHQKQTKLVVVVGAVEVGGASGSVRVLGAAAVVELGGVGGVAVAELVVPGRFRFDWFPDWKWKGGITIPLLVVVAAADEQGGVEPAGEARVARWIVPPLAPPAQFLGRPRRCRRRRRRRAGIHCRRPERDLREIEISLWLGGPAGCP